MNKSLNFDLINVDSLRNIVRRGLIGYAVNSEKHIGLSTLWLFLADGELLKIYSKMTDTVGWNEVGTLVFQLVPIDENAPRMRILPQQWRSVTQIEKLVVAEDDFVAESGLKISNGVGEALTIVCSADVYRIELQAPFFSGGFQPEYELTRYTHVPL